jgi:hypothetical protein
VAMPLRIAIAAVVARAVVEVVGEAIALETGRCQAAVPEAAVLLAVPEVAEVRRDRAALEVLPAWEVPAAAVAGGRTELRNP